MLLKSTGTIILLLISLIFTLQGPIVCSESKDDRSGRSPRTSKSSLKRLKTISDDKLEEITTREHENKAQYASEADVHLVRGKITKRKTKSPPDNYFWSIFYHQERAGKVSIDLIDEPLLGRHASIQIFLNKKSQGMHIGRIAYAKACNLSHYDVVYASMRKNNLASFRSAQAAGFKEVKNPAFAQCVMKWVRLVK